ncbi:MAG: zf-HC2 domain-containing protein [bacterium]|nr:zf-HC2 domain-containing protein [bacterium]
MNCEQAHDGLPLLAGDDLPADEARRLMAHIADCPACAADLASLRLARTRIRRIGELDRPADLTTDFVTDLETALLRRRQIRHRAPRLVFGGLALAVLVLLLIWRFAVNPQAPESERITTPVTVVEADGEPERELLWTEIGDGFTGCFEGPYRLEELELSNQPGVMAVMHKPDPADRPNTFILDYCGEAQNLSTIRSYPWLAQRLRRMARRAGDEKNLYIAVCTMPESSRSERTARKQALLHEFKPFFNRIHGKGI